VPDTINEEIKEVEEENEEEESIQVKKQMQSRSNVNISNLNSRSNMYYNENNSMLGYDYRGFEYNATNVEELKKNLIGWISKKYILKLLSGFKIILEETIQLLLLISSVYKDSVVGLVLLFGVFLYMIRRKIRTIQRLAWITGVSMIVQYALALSNLTSYNNPM
jgi:hypothetical protein